VPQSQEDWLRVRSYLDAHRHELAEAACELYPAAWRVAGTSCMAGPGWLAGIPVPLDRVSLSWRPGVHERGVDGTGPAAAAVLPVRARRAPFVTYADALGELRRPGLYQNRACYRLLDVTASPAAAHLAFGVGRYFDLINVCEAVAHEYATAVLADRENPKPVAGEVPVLRSLIGDPAVAHVLPLRALVGNPADPKRRPMMTAVTTLTLRADRAAGTARMILHWRDPAQVASGGGLYQVAPAGMFQPSHDAPWNRENDFDLWRAIVRELSEELLGGDEDYRSGRGPIDDDGWPFYATLTKARQAGLAKVHWLGVGFDPLTLAADQLTVLVLDAALFDEEFAGLVTDNAEGRILADTGPGPAAQGIPFTAENIERFTTTEPMQSAAAALLRTAWEHRDVLLA
jgi:hypothetical protein